MVFKLAARCSAVVLAFALCACTSSKNSSKPPVTTGTPDPSATGGNGATTPTTGEDGGTTTTGDADGGTTMPTPPGDGGTTPTGGDDGGTTNPKPPTHHRCGWMNDNPTAAKASLVANPDFFDAIHPYWWTLTAAGNVTATSWVDDATVISTAHAHAITLMPLVYGGDDATAIRAVIASPSSIAAHVQVLVNLAVSRHYDGLELDYEHLWTKEDRPGFTQLVTQLGAALHAQGKQLSLAVPAIDVDYGIDGYDYKALAAAADVIHLMGYDFHGDFSDHLGPLAPLGWIDAVNARVQAAGIGNKFVLGIGNYGVGLGWYAVSADAISMCGANYATTTTHMQSCPYGVYNAGRSPHCTTSKGDLWFEDGASIAEKANSAKAHGLRGVAYYDLGGEAPGLFTALRAAYP